MRPLCTAFKIDSIRCIEENIKGKIKKRKPLNVISIHPIERDIDFSRREKLYNRSKYKRNIKKLNYIKDFR